MDFFHIFSFCIIRQMYTFFWKHSSFVPYGHVLTIITLSYKIRQITLKNYRKIGSTSSIYSSHFFNCHISIVNDGGAILNQHNIFVLLWLDILCDFHRFMNLFSNCLVGILDLGVQNIFH